MTVSDDMGINTAASSGPTSPTMASAAPTAL